MRSKTRHAHVCAPERHGKDFSCPACLQSAYYRYLSDIKKEEGYPGPGVEFERLVWVTCLSEQQIEQYLGELRFRFGTLATAMAFNLTKIDVVWMLRKLQSLTGLKNSSVVRMKAIEMIDRLRTEALQGRGYGAASSPSQMSLTVDQKVTAEAEEPDDWGKNDE